MFRQVDRSLEQAQGGLGIGLTLVRRLIELHGGTINAQSEGPGKGTEFIARLSLADDQAIESPPAEATPVIERSLLRILVVDDSRDSADTLSLLLRRRGHEVRTAGDGIEALDVTSEFLPEVILMDVGMPKMNGYDATRHIRQLPRGNEIFIVALTGWGQPDDVRCSSEAGCSAHLVKPVDFAALEQLIASWNSASR